MKRSDLITFIGVPLIIIELCTLIGVHTIKAEAKPIDIKEAPPIETVAETETESVVEIVETAAAPVLDLYPEPKETYLGQFRLTAYCGCSKCNGKWGAIDRFGNPLKLGTIAVDPDVIPLGSKVRIGDKIYTARDTGGKWVQGEHIDIYMESHHQAKMFGTQYGDVFLIKEDK